MDRAYLKASISGTSMATRGHIAAKKRIRQSARDMGVFEERLYHVLVMYGSRSAALKSGRGRSTFKKQLSGTDVMLCLKQLKSKSVRDFRANEIQLRSLQYYKHPKI